ncbi:MAG: DMT family transporter, partial [Alphaproteobacteria bacterium]
MTWASMISASRLANAFDGLPQTTRGMLWMVLATFVLTGMAATIKHLGQTIHPVELLFFRGAFGFVMMLPFAARVGVAGLRTDKLRLYILRAMLTVFAGTCGFWAFKLIPLAEATAIIFSRPLFAMLIAIVVLKETVGARRWTATLIGFAGVLIMVRPGIAEITPGVALALGAAVLAAFAAV